MSKKSHAKRAAKVKARKKQAFVPARGIRATTDEQVQQLMAQLDEDTAHAVLVAADNTTLMSLVSEGDEWLVLIGDEPVAGTTDLNVALGLLLRGAIDDKRGGEESYVQFSHYLMELLEEQVEASGMEWVPFMESLIPGGLGDGSLPKIGPM